MEMIILSLKTLYMTLMNEDFPIYSESVIGRNERKGQTVLRFWQGQMIEEFRCLPCGKMLWRNDGKRNKYPSYLCNRSAMIKTYSEYAAEISSKVSILSILNQTSRFVDFLSLKKYRHNILIRRIRELVRLAEQDDPKFSEQITAQIRRIIAWQTDGVQESLFQAAYLLTLLMLYAAAGEAMNDPVMAVLRDENYQIENVWEAYKKQSEYTESSMEFLTVHSGILEDNPLPAHRYFGREEELFNLGEIALTGRKCLITGIGGIGKTELLRQLIRRCKEENIVDKIAVVTYENSIVESFGRCFPESDRQEMEEKFRMLLCQLQKESTQSKVLLIIDNLTNGTAEDPDLLKLKELECAVLVTSRRKSLEGFEVYPMHNPSVRIGSLIFRDNLGRPLSREDQGVILELISDEALCHPLTLRLMAKAARVNGWTVQELQNRMSGNSILLEWKEEERNVHLAKIYRQLYSYMKIPKEYQGIVELFTLLPRESYSSEFLEEWFHGICGVESQTKLNSLAEGGWLEADNNGYSMHPLIAQCLRRKMITEEWLEPFLAEIKKYFEQSAYDDRILQRLCDIEVTACSFLVGNVGPVIMRTLQKAMFLQNFTRSLAIQNIMLLDRLMKHGVGINEQLIVGYWTLRGQWNNIEIKEVRELYQKQKTAKTVPEDAFLDFCLHCGFAAAYLQEYDLAEQMLKEFLDERVTTKQRAMAFYHLSICYEYRGDVENALFWLEKSVECVRKYSLDDKRLMLTILSRLLQYWIKFGQKEKAEALRVEIKELGIEDLSLSDRFQIVTVEAAYELYYGDLEKALLYYREAAELIKEYYGRSREYYMSIGQMAIVLQRLKRYEEALESYHELITYAKESNDAMQLHLFSNNISVVYLEMEQPKEALLHLETAMILAREQGGIALGECLRNMARACGQLKDYSKEKECLLEAVPLLNEAYGVEHPRAKASAERLAELINR